MYFVCQSIVANIAQKGKFCYHTAMISQIRGVVLYKDIRHIVVNVAGVGYKVATTPSILDNAREGNKITLWTHLAVRENALDLYGFESKEDLDLFEMLITVSGIGPKTAIGVLAVVLPETVRMAISSGETAYLTKVSGVGKKIAEKIVRELRGKFEGMDATGAGAEDFKKDSDVIEALKSLGYSQNEARETLQKVSKEIKNTGARVKEALKILGSKM